VGDVMYDAMIYFGKISGSHSTIVKDLNLKQNDFILATIHRAENTNDLEKLHGILKTLNEVSREIQIVFPIHPRTRQMLPEQLDLSNIKIIDPIGYFDMLELQRNCRLIVTDSGGIQKEAYLNKKYCITVRQETEWRELVDGGFNFLAPNIGDIGPLAKRLYNSQFPDNASPLYGDGNAAEKIKEILLSRFEQ
jgi:UDP-GlcNAc3NAcA epimerase